MAHIVYITVGMASTLNSSLELSRRLTEAGHRVTYVSHVDVEPQVAAHGYSFRLLKRDKELSELREREEPPWRSGAGLGPGAVLRWIRRCREIRRMSVENDEIETVVASLDPDLLIIDIEMHFAVIATARLRIPTVLAIVWFSIFRRPNLPPLHFNMMRGDSWRQRFAIRRAWWHARLSTVAFEWRLRFSRRGLLHRLSPIQYGSVYFDDLKAVAKHRDYDLRSEVDRSQWLRPFLYRRLPILCFNVWEMEFPHERAPNLHYVGPMVNREPGRERLDAGSRERWDRLRGARESGSRVAGPLVYASLGTFWSADRGFLRRILEVFERRPEWDLVLGLGGKLNAQELASVPSNATLLDWAPQVEILKVADCAITHGGITTINECVRLKVPMVVYSTKHVDQDGCAARISYHGLGVVADKDKDTSEQVEMNIERALTDLVIRENVAKMQAHMLACEESNLAVDLIGKILSKEK